MSFNPKLQEFLKENKNQTILGFAWSCYWRLYVTIFGIAFVIGLIAAMFD